MPTNDATLVPFLKWAGGKRWLVHSNKLPIPKEYNRYIEPFLGSAAVFFHIAPPNAILADANHALIELYQVVRDSPSRLMKQLKVHHRLHCRDYYYHIRSVIPRGRVQRAARFLYLNRTCWNGLYRVNKMGFFNVPIGSKLNVLLDTDDFHLASKRLKASHLRAQDFEETLSEASSGDFVFVDPPYTVKHNLNNFVKYNQTIFSWEDQERLRDSIVQARGRGAMLVVTNANHPSIHKLYAGLAVRTSANRYSVLAGDSSYRRETSESIFRINF